MLEKGRNKKLPLYLLGYTISGDVPLSFQIDYFVSSSSELYVKFVRNDINVIDRQKLATIEQCD